MKNVVPYDRIARNLSTWPFGSFDSFFDAPYSALSSVSSDAFVMNVEDAGQSYVVTAELPGVSKENIDVELNEGRLLNHRYSQGVRGGEGQELPAQRVF